MLEGAGHLCFVSQLDSLSQNDRTVIFQGVETVLGLFGGSEDVLAVLSYDRIVTALAFSAVGKV